MQSFDFSYPTTVHFGEGALARSLPGELEKVLRRLGRRHAGERRQRR